MKIFHSFDTKLKDNKVKKYTEKFGADNILVLSTSRLFLLLFVRLPLIVTILANIFLLYGIYRVSNHNRAWTIYIGVPTTLIFIFFVIFHGILKAYMDYHMDFCIITPLQVEKIDQTGLFQRDTNAMSASKIKSVNVNKK